MFDFDFPPSVKGEVLDDYLLRGWFRIGSFVHTVSSTCYDDVEHPVYWLRYNVKAIKLTSKNTKLILANSNFTIHCCPLEIRKETEQLFKKYKKGLKFKINPSLDSILVDKNNETFDSRIMEVRDNARLIAAGVFDVGKNSIENIINLYDHAYAKHSLGKFLMISIYRYCLENGFDYYYPGYYLPGQQVMSYKLFLDKGATEVYIPEQNAWICYHEFERRIQ